jgi:hypothetical protein
MQEVVEEVLEVQIEEHEGMEEVEPLQIHNEHDETEQPTLVDEEEELHLMEADLPEVMVVLV